MSLWRIIDIQTITDAYFCQAKTGQTLFHIWDSGLSTVLPQGCGKVLEYTRTFEDDLSPSCLFLANFSSVF